MDDFEVELGALRADVDQELRIDGDWAEVTVSAPLLLRLLDAVQPKYNRGDEGPPRTPPRT
jgi:hypothetical protein